MRVVFLGTGTSHGVPMIGCDCPVCTSSDTRNVRTRSSVFVETQGVRILIDTTPELRVQALRERIRVVDAVLLTHAHADHIFGLDDIRRFNELSGRPMPCYGPEDTLSTVRRAFEYAFVPTQIGGGKPSLSLIPAVGPFEVAGVGVIPVPVRHGELRIFGYRIGRFAYVTDCSGIPADSLGLLRGLETLVLGVLRPEPHETHFSVSEGLAVVEEVKPERALFTHISHRLDHEQTNRALPPYAQLAYDGLEITTGD
jgi:phosphoribosyl 1,2-cyclic phosphate phosphodiesterase